MTMKQVENRVKKLKALEGQQIYYNGCNLVHVVIKPSRECIV